LSIIRLVSRVSPCGIDMKSSLQEFSCYIITIPAGGGWRVPVP
jgi:hypothetical protein